VVIDEKIKTLGGLAHLLINEQDLAAKMAGLKSEIAILWWPWMNKIKRMNTNPCQRKLSRFLK